MDGLRPQLALFSDGGLGGKRKVDKQCRERCCSRATRHGREDFAAIRSYIEGGGYATIREHEIYRLCVCDEVSLARAGERLDIAYETVRDYLRSLRWRVRHPDARGIHRARQPAKQGT